MSSLNIKQGSEAHFPEYPLASPSNNEIDLLSLIEVLWRAKNGHGGRFCVCLRRVTDLFHPAAKMDQLSRHYSRRSHSVAGLEKTFTKLRVLDLDINIDRGGAFNLFIKKFQSVSLLEEYLRSSPYVMDQLKRRKSTNWICIELSSH